MKQAVCRICGLAYEPGTYREHVRGLHPTELSTSVQRAARAVYARWTRSMAEEMEADYRAGVPIAKLAEQHGVSDARIRQIFDKYDIRLRPDVTRPPRVVAEIPPIVVPPSRRVAARQQLVEKYGDQWSEVVRLRRRGKSLTAVAHEVARSDVADEQRGQA